MKHDPRDVLGSLVVLATVYAILSRPQPRPWIVFVREEEVRST